MGKVQFSKVCVCQGGYLIVYGAGSFPGLWSQVLFGGGYPVFFGSRFLPWPVVPGPFQWAGGTPVPSLVLPGEGVLQPRTEIPPPPDRIGVSPYHTGRGRLCGAGGIPLAFTHEDFLVYIILYAISYFLLFFKI